MSNQFLSAASLSFEYGHQKGFIISNTTNASVQDAITVNKTALTKSYFLNKEIFYCIAIINNKPTTIKNLKISENLGAYSNSSLPSEAKFIPLDYSGPSFLYINGAFDSQIIPEIYSDKTIFKVNDLPAYSNILLIYSATVNNKAPISKKSSIINISNITSDEISKPVLCSKKIFVDEKADINIVKYMYPNPALPGELITYNFTIYNYGNTKATNVKLNDTLLPAPNNLNVAVNSKNLPRKDYSYINGTLNIPSYDSNFSISIPPAKFLQDSTTGTFTTSPGVTNIIVSGKIWLNIDRLLRKN